MHVEAVQILRCPRTGQKLELVEPAFVDGRVQSGWLVSSDGSAKYPVRNFIPRFVPAENYAGNFGMQWNKFRRTQLDSESGHAISADRFWISTGWSAQELSQQWVLDVGCGAGRFAEIALGTGAQVVALDYSSAVDACYANLSRHPNLLVVQGDVYALPFAPRIFRFVYSLGVLQHTPDVQGAFLALLTMLGPGGRLCVDFYEKSWRSALHPKYWLRPVTKRLQQDWLFRALQRSVPTLLKVSDGLGRLPSIGRALKRMVPVANYDGILPLSERQRIEWALLDTFDWLAPRYDNPQSSGTVAGWMRNGGLERVEIFRAGHLVARGTVANAPGH